MIPRPRKLLAAAPLLAAALAGCGTTASPAARTAAYSAPVRAPMVLAPLTLSEAAPAAESKGPAAEPQVVPVAAATPMCDSNGRPLSGNVRTKSAGNECTPDQLTAAAVTPGTE